MIEKAAVMASILMIVFNVITLLIMSGVPRDDEEKHLLIAMRCYIILNSILLMWGMTR